MRISVVQSAIEWESIDINLTNFTTKIDEVAANSDLILLPEMFTTGFSMNPELLAENFPGKTVDWIQHMAKKQEVAIAGSHIALENGKYYNRMIFAHPDGKIELYNKRHLFRMANEDKHYSAGSKRVIVSYKGWRILLLVCYDLRFPVWSRVKNDYDMIAIVANFPERRKYAWNSLLVARAIENQCYVAACNRVGTDGNGVNHCGDSQIIDPAGQIISLAKPNTEETITANISMDYLISTQKNFPVHLDSDRFEII